MKGFKTNNYARHYYSIFHRVFPGFRMWRLAKENLIKRELKIDSVILDIGCGPADYWPREYSVVGLDSNKEFTKLVSMKINRLIGDYSYIPFAKSSFDAITLFDFIEHIDNPHRFLEEISRFLKPTGKLVIVTPNYQSLKYLLAERLILNTVLRMPANHYTLFGMESLVRLFRDKFKASSVGTLLGGMILYGIAERPIQR